MSFSRSAKIRSTLAACIGIPSTLLFGGLVSVIFIAVESTGQLRLKEFLFILWALAGIGGIASFWVWVFAARPLSQTMKAAISFFIVSGEVAAFLVIFGYDGNIPQRVLAAVSMFVGMVICGWLWLPKLPLNPDKIPIQSS